jgi:lipid A 3-O-deacylase
MKLRVSALAAGLACCTAGAAGPANAEIVQANVGLMAHNIQVIDPKNAHKEQGPDIQAELDFKTPRWLKWTGGARPYAMASINTQGDTSYVAAGVSWRLQFLQRWAFEPSLGLAVHDGDLGDKFPPGDPRRPGYIDSHLLLGSRTLFRTGLGFTRMFSDRWGAQVLYEHLSNGHLFAGNHDRNQGLDDIGVRLIYRR